ncbi:MAG: lipopolysaccharide biosynthesis protein [Ahrensia sp.]|nr:lipopolysaccharide biosynthesis protein [Ahrensia sp.]
MTAAGLTANVVNMAQKYGLTRDIAFDYSSLLGGQLGRLVFSLVYFVTLTKALSLGDFGVFATGSAIGIVLSRIAGFGFLSPLYRVSVTRPRLIGSYSLAYLSALVLSLPLIVGIAMALYFSLYTEFMPIHAFLLIVLAEVLMWRSLEVVIIVNNGLNRFATGSMLGIAGVAAKAVSAFWFLFHGNADLELWTMIYFATNAAIALSAIAFFYPKQRLRWRPRAWLGRMRDAVGVSAAEALFYIQAELDKVLVLALGGEMVAGKYSIIMRLVDLTAMPLRALSTLLIQWIMRKRQAGQPTRHGLLIDMGIGLVSSSILAAAAVILWALPGVFGNSIAIAAPFVPLLLLVPAFRNILEYHTELLYAHEMMAIRVVLLIYVGSLKAFLLWMLLGTTSDFAVIAVWLNAVFAVLWLCSALVTYGRLRMERDRASKAYRVS